MEPKLGGLGILRASAAFVCRALRFGAGTVTLGALAIAAPEIRRLIAALPAKYMWAAHLIRRLFSTARKGEARRAAIVAALGGIITWMLRPTGPCTSLLRILVGHGLLECHDDTCPSCSDDDTSLSHGASPTFPGWSPGLRPTGI
mmetsp:Transcript_76107/g.150873  ORF Transcript_76107/g.150873 Transcript_76107/m.150873 type:complete len:145 (-) Transcript_76107:19-453(-)